MTHDNNLVDFLFGKKKRRALKGKAGRKVVETKVFENDDEISDVK